MIFEPMSLAAISNICRNELPHLDRQLAAAVLRVVAMHDQRQSVTRSPFDQDIERTRSRRDTEEVVSRDA